MDRKTALSAAGAVTMTSVAAVTALFMTIDRGAGVEPTPVTPEIVTEYQVVTLDADDAPAAEVVSPDADTTQQALPAPEPEIVQTTVYEVEYVQAPAADPVAHEDAEDEGDEYEDDEYDDDEHEQGEEHDEYEQGEYEDEEYEEGDDD